MMDGRLLDLTLSRRPKSIAAMAVRLKITRTGLGLTQAELCRRADLSRNTYNQWERGHGRPDVHYAIRLCEAFGLTLDWIYRGETHGLSPALAETVRRARDQLHYGATVSPMVAGV